VWEDTRNPYDRGLRRNWVELCCCRLGGVPPEMSPALVRDSDEEAMLPSQPADHGQAGLGGAAEASRLEEGEGSGAAHDSGAMGKGLAAGHEAQEMLPMAAPQPLPVADEGRAALPGGGGGGGGGGDAGDEASEDWGNLELERRAMLEMGEAKSGD